MIQVYASNSLFYIVVVWPRLATKDNAMALLPLLPLGWGEEWKEKGKKLMDRDKGSITQQQRKQTATTKKLIERIYKTNSRMHKATLTARHPARSQAAMNFPLASSLTQNRA